MTKDAYLIGGPAAGRVVTIHEDQDEFVIQWMQKPKSAVGPIFHKGKYAPKTPSDLAVQEFHWMGEY